MTVSLVNRGRCPGTSVHGDESAYTRYGCRCPDAREVTRVKRKRRREGRAEPVRISVTGLRRRIEGLRALGYTDAEIITASDVAMPIQAISQILHRRNWTYPVYAEGVKRAYEKLRYGRGQHKYASRLATKARQAGYLPPDRWADEDIDDPDATPLQRWRKTAKDGDGIIDQIALDLVHDGQRPFATLTRPERLALYLRYRGQHNDTELSRRWRTSGWAVADLRRQAGEQAAA
jgi:hypothetical protein